MEEYLQNFSSIKVRLDWFRIPKLIFELVKTTLECDTILDRFRLFYVRFAIRSFISLV